MRLSIANMLFLDSEDRRKFDQREFEYLIEQVQTHHEIFDFAPYRIALGFKYFTQTKNFDCGNSFAIERVLNDMYVRKHIESFLDVENIYTHEDLNKQINIPFHNPCKELFWIIKPINKNTYSDLIDKSEIVVNGLT